MNHLLRDCFKAKEVWFAIVGRHWYLNMCSKPWKDWIICRLKLNTDGCRRMGGEGGFGGLIRDERGTWVCGYYGKLHSGTSLEAELWAIYKGLTVILQKGMNNVTIETECEQAMKLLKEEPNAKCPFKGLVEDAHIIMRGCECTVQRVYKEGNLCADALAKFGATQPKEILVVNEPPAGIKEFLVADMIGMSCERA
ncbi:unnamed protein product [Camellia sinensis]